MSENLFRRISLERLSSPEQLDERVKVTSSRAWLALITIACILLCAVVWAFTGSLTTKIEGQGILVNNGGVVLVRHNTEGPVIDIRFKTGEMVKKGDVIARIDIPGLVEKCNNLINTINSLKSNGCTDSSMIKKVERQLAELRKEMDYSSQIISPCNGRIVELNIDKGCVVKPGEVLLSLEQYDETTRLEAVIYVSEKYGGSILPGMEAQISPTVVNKEEYGFMMGRVISVSEFPVTEQSMMQTLDNEKLVSLLAGKGAPLMVCIDLVPDAGTESGYKWSTPKGPPISINSGVLVQSSVIISKEKPISKVLPLIKGVVH